MYTTVQEISASLQYTCVRSVVHRTPTHVQRGVRIGCSMSQAIFILVLFLFFENYAHIPCFVCDLVPGLMEWFRGHIWNVGQGDREGARCADRGTGRGHGVPIIFTGTHSLRLLVACWKLFSTARFDHSFRSMCARIFV